MANKLLKSKAGRFQFTGSKLVLGLVLMLGSGAFALAAIVPDVSKTRHNLSTSNALPAAGGSSFGNSVKAVSETQICVFCHTPHAATTGIVAPLWNRTLSNATYTFYSSFSMDAYPPSDPPIEAGTGSKLCLSCHDGTLAIGTVSVLNNNPASPVTIDMQNTGTGGTMPDSLFPNSGFTRKIGMDLSNDHPISFTYDAALAEADGELYTPGDTSVAVANRVRGQPVPQFPLINNQVECITCHDPHLRSDEIDPTNGQPINNKFLRGNRFQKVSPTTSTTNNFDPAKDIMCLACHNKPTWATSTHSNELATKEIYKDSAAELRDFPHNITTWQAACSNCHDVHTVPGSRRLLREAVDTVVTSGMPKTSGNPAIEQVCFQCHSPEQDRILVKDTPDEVPDIKTDFSLPYRMPIVTEEQGEVPLGGGAPLNPTSPGEIHNIGVQAINSTDTYYLGSNPNTNVSRGKDFLETRTLMGAELSYRHAECTDCHQPHRVTRTQLFNGDSTLSATTGTHRHAGSGDPPGDLGSVPHNNLASGSQRGHFGVEPVYSSDASFYNEPLDFVEKRGPVAVGASTDVNSPWLTREYQICAKCHSNYSFGTNRPSLGRTGGTPYGTNGMEIYTNIFREIHAPSSHQGNATPGDSGAHNGPAPYAGMNSYMVNFTGNNRRSWHPVMRPTGRTPALRNADADNWLWPWTNDIGYLTMYCTDCHGSNTAAATVVPTGGIDGAAWGPHGSSNIFILKGWWDSCTGGTAGVQACLNDPLVSTDTVPQNTAARLNTDTSNDLCFKCHSYARYAGGAPSSSGFGGPSGANLHANHVSRSSGRIRCMWCHVAVPHGWKNKALLVNLNDVGPEATCREEDADDLLDGYKCDIGAPMSPGTQMRNGPGPQPHGSIDANYWANRGYSNPPYYRNAMLKIKSFAPSGSWQASNCGSIGSPGNGVDGACGGWMAASNENCSGPP